MVVGTKKELNKFLKLLKTSQIKEIRPELFYTTTVSSEKIEGLYSLLFIFDKKDKYGNIKYVVRPTDCYENGYILDVLVR